MPPHPDSDGLEPLPLQAVESSDLEGVGYDPALEILDVKFKKSKKTRRFFNVGTLIHQGLMTADRPGVYFAKHIRNHYMGRDI